MQDFFLMPLTACKVKCGILKLSSKKITRRLDLGKDNANTSWRFYLTPKQDMISFYHKGWISTADEDSKDHCIVYKGD